MRLTSTSPKTCREFLRREAALAIRTKIKQETGLNTSAGIFYGTFLAKLASDYRKPNGQYVNTRKMLTRDGHPDNDLGHLVFQAGCLPGLPIAS